MLFIPEKIENILKTITSYGFEAYLVGGCVRDMLTNTVPHDYDIATDAKPEDIMSFFEKTVPTGIKHGTVTVLSDNISVEVTTYRTESNYTDSRHPQNISFVSDLKEDLARRDFTVNAMAYNNEDGLRDYFGGESDIAAECLRAVGDPDTRFREDALRIMRLFRFSSVLGFKAEPATLAAALRNAPLLKNISAERISAELLKTLTGKNPKALLPLCKCGGLGFLGLGRTPDFESLKLLKKDSRLALFLFLKSADADMTEALNFLKLPRSYKSFFNAMSELSAMPFPKTKPEIKEMLFISDEEIFGCYLNFCRAYLKEDTHKAKTLFDEILTQKEPYRTEDLKINGNRLREMGISGRRTGEILELLRKHILNNPDDNTTKRLTEKTKELNRN